MNLLNHSYAIWKSYQTVTDMGIKKEVLKYNERMDTWLSGPLKRVGYAGLVNRDGGFTGWYTYMELGAAQLFNSKHSF